MFKQDIIIMYCKYPNMIMENLILNFGGIIV